MASPTIDPDGTYRFERPTWRVWLDLFATPVAAVVFVGFAVAIWTDAIPIPGQQKVLFAGMISLFAALLVLATLASWRRGRRKAILEVGPAGIWTPEMGLLAWPDVADIRRESYLSPGTSRGPRMIRRERLGIEPRRGAQLSGTALNSASRGLIGAYDRFLKSRVSIDTGVEKLAPFGVEMYELGIPLETVAAAVAKFHPVS